MDVFTWHVHAFSLMACKHNMSIDWYRNAIGSVLRGSAEGILQVQGLKVPQDPRFQTEWVFIDKRYGYWLIQMCCRQYPQEANQRNLSGGSFNTKTILADSEMSKGPHDHYFDYWINYTSPLMMILQIKFTFTYRLSFLKNPKLLWFQFTVKLMTHSNECCHVLWDY